MKRLGDFTTARVQLGTAGDSVPVKPLLEFRLAHARARDAVRYELDSHSLMQEMRARGWCARSIRSAAKSREEYLRRPDRGRILDDCCANEVADTRNSCVPVFIVADGLSALAVHRHALQVLDRVLPELAMTPDEQNPIWIAHQGRVALGDHIGELRNAPLSVVILGERPGLSTPDSLGVYLTWAPRRGRTDSERNCISNIHAHGLSYEEAAHKLLFLIRESQRRQLSGVNLKETAGQDARVVSRRSSLSTPSAVEGQ